MAKPQAFVTCRCLWGSDGGRAGPSAALLLTTLRAADKCIEKKSIKIVFEGMPRRR
jgi:hypothetical protein